MSGRGYYVTGPVPDVPGRPAEMKPSLHVLRAGAKCLARLRALPLLASRVIEERPAACSVRSTEPAWT